MTVWNDPALYPSDGVNYLCFTAEDDDVEVALLCLSGSSSAAPHVEYRTSDGRHGYLTCDDTGVTLYNEGDSVYLYGENSTFSDEDNFFTLMLYGFASCSGSVMTLLDPTDTLRSLAGKPYCFASLFEQSTNLTSAPELPATELDEYCYYRMFADGGSYIESIELPATDLEEGCYVQMFDMTSSDLTYVKIWYTGDFDLEYFEDWMPGLVEPGDFYYNGHDRTVGRSGIPGDDWTVHTF